MPLKAHNRHFATVCFRLSYEKHRARHPSAALGPHSEGEQYEEAMYRRLWPRRCGLADFRWVTTNRKSHCWENSRHLMTKKKRRHHGRSRSGRLDVPPPKARSPFPKGSSQRGKIARPWCLKAGRRRHEGRWLRLGTIVTPRPESLETRTKESLSQGRAIHTWHRRKSSMGAPELHQTNSPAWAGATQMLRLVEALEGPKEHDDVQHVYSPNFDIDESEIQAAVRRKLNQPLEFQFFSKEPPGHSRGLALCFFSSRAL